MIQNADRVRGNVSRHPMAPAGWPIALCIGLLSLLACTLGQTSGRVSLPTVTPVQVQVLAPQVYYVAVNDPKASDSNNGLRPAYVDGKNGPWRTIRQAAKTAQAGDTVFVRAGTYNESGIRFAHSGRAGAPITLSNYQSEQVIVDGTKSSSQNSGIEIRPGTGHFVIKGLEIRNMPRNGIMTDAATQTLYQDITIRDCLLDGNGLSGIRLAAVDGFLVENVQSHDNGYYGIDLHSSENGALSVANGAVKSSAFYNHTGKEGHGLAINQGHDIVISDSRAYHNKIHGFDVSDMPKGGEFTHDVRLERNVSYDNGHAGFSINSNSHHVVFRNNVAMRNGAAWAKENESSGFLCYETCWHVEYYNNVSFQNSEAGFWIQDKLAAYGRSPDSLIVFKNNITFDNGQGDTLGAALVVEGTDWEVVASHNNWGGNPSQNTPVVGIHLINGKGEIYTRDQVNQGAFQTRNVSVDPLFANMASGDVRLKSGSPAIDLGTDVGLPFCGQAPDLGAIETCDSIS